MGDLSQIKGLIFNLWIIFSLLCAEAKAMGMYLNYQNKVIYRAPYTQIRGSISACMEDHRSQTKASNIHHHGKMVIGLHIAI